MKISKFLKKSSVFLVTFSPITFLFSLGCGKEEMKKEEASPVVVKTADNQQAQQKVPNETEEQAKKTTPSPSKVAQTVKETWSEAQIEAKKKSLSVLEKVLDDASELHQKTLDLKEEIDSYNTLLQNHNIQNLKIESAKQAYEIGKYDNWTFAREAMFYIFSLKFIWGLFTGYEPTTIYSKEYENLEVVKERSGKALEELEQSIQIKESKIKSMLEELGKSYDALIERTSSPSLRIKIRESKNFLSRNVEGFLASVRQLEEADRLKREADKIKEPFIPDSFGQKHTPNIYYFEEFSTNYLSDFFVKKKSYWEKTVGNYEKRIERFYNGAFPSKASSLELLKEINTLIAKEKNVIKDLRKAASFLSTDSNNVEEDVFQKSLAFFSNFEELLDSSTEVFNAFNQLRQIETRLEQAGDQVFLKEEVLRKKKSHGSSLFREIGLYVFTFKWLWGLFTNYENTVFVGEEWAELENAKTAFQALEEQMSESYALAEQKLFSSIRKMLDLMKETKKSATTPAQKLAIGKYTTYYVKPFLLMRQRYKVFLERQGIALKDYENIWEMLPQNSRYADILKWFDDSIVVEAKKYLRPKLPKPDFQDDYYKQLERLEKAFSEEAKEFLGSALEEFESLSAKKRVA